MLQGICMCFYEAIVQSMFKHVASEYAQLVLTLQISFNTAFSNFHCIKGTLIEIK